MGSGTEVVKPRRIIDISSPGETTPDTSSRPVVVSHKPSVQDPMVSAPVETKVDAAAEKISVSHPTPPTETSQPVNPEPTPVESPAPPLETPPQPEQNIADQPDVKQLVHDKTYFVPIAKPPKRHGFPWLFALLITIGAGLYLFLTIM